MCVDVLFWYVLLIAALARLGCQYLVRRATGTSLFHVLGVFSLVLLRFGEFINNY